MESSIVSHHHSDSQNIYTPRLDGDLAVNPQGVFPIALTAQTFKSKGLIIEFKPVARTAATSRFEIQAAT